ncbi:MAG: 7-carboxy-7-deazaguanine synthase QueE [Planctomycetaceae bacterium]|nr:7-carboxy-7-deazaguanine synthase QueE [Planctomycetaceae bacterium]
MRIAELFHSIQGEGRLLGVPSVFVRTSGCNLRCWFCDTPYTSWQPEGDERSVDEILQELAAIDCEHVVITGGEPMLVRELVSLTEELHRRGHHITIETAGTVDLPVFADLMSISPKLSNSTPDDHRNIEGQMSSARVVGSWTARHDAQRHRPEVIRRLIRDYDYQLKFVIDDADDVLEVERWLIEFPEVPDSRVYLMAQAIDRDALVEKSRWIAEIVKSHGWRLSPRLHVELWGNTRGT